MQFVPLLASIIVACTGLAFPYSAAAQSGENDFTGVVIGAHAGLANHHIGISETVNGVERPTVEAESFAVGGVITLGYDLKLAPRFTLGAEGGVHFGGIRATLLASDGSINGIKPRYGFSGVARLGYRANDRTMIYGSAGYGHHEYRGVGALPDFQNNSFILGISGEYAISKRTSIRVTASHFDGTRNEILLGVPIRF